MRAVDSRLKPEWIAWAENSTEGPRSREGRRSRDKSSSIGAAVTNSARASPCAVSANLARKAGPSTGQGSPARRRQRLRAWCNEVRKKCETFGSKTKKTSVPVTTLSGKCNDDHGINMSTQTVLTLWYDTPVTEYRITYVKHEEAKLQVQPFGRPFRFNRAIGLRRCKGARENIPT